MLEFVLALAAVAFALECFGPWLLAKFFPQQALAPAPEVPKRTAARNNQHVDNSLEEVSGVKLASATAEAPEVSGTNGLVAVASADALPEASFDYDEFRPAAREVAPAVVVSQGLPDVFEDEVPSVTA